MQPKREKPALGGLQPGTLDFSNHRKDFPMIMGVSMKRALLIVFAMFLASPALAAGSRDPSAFYFGMGYSGTSLSAPAADLPTSLTAGGDIHIGERFNKYFGVELGVSGANAEHDVTTGALTTADKMSIYGPNIDLLGYLPLWTDQFSLIGTVGATYQTGKSTIENVTTTTVQASEFGGRVGAGLEWRPVRFFSLDMIGRYETTNFKNYDSGAKNLTLDFNIYF